MNYANMQALNHTLAALCQAALALETLLEERRAVPDARERRAAGGDGARQVARRQRGKRANPTTVDGTATLSGAMIMAFEQCGGAPATPHDRDANDAVFTVTANSLFDGERCGRARTSS